MTETLKVIAEKHDVLIAFEDQWYVTINDETLTGEFLSPILKRFKEALDE